MKLLFLSSLYPPYTRGGGEISTHLLAQALVSRGHEVTVLTATATGEHQRQDKTLDGVRVLYLPLPLTAKPLFERRHATRMARRIISESSVELSDYDVVHAHDFRSALVVHELVRQQAVTREVTVVTARDYAQVCGSPNNLMADGSACDDCARLTCIVKNQAVVEAPLVRRPFRVWQYWFNIEYRRQVFLHFPKQVFISRDQQREIERIQDTSEQKTAVIYNPISPVYFSAKVKQAMNTTILYVGRVQKYKGVDVLLEAWRDLVRTYPDVQLQIVGVGDQLRYEHLVSQWGLQYQVSFTGAVAYDRMRDLYDSAAIVVAPHVWHEPFGRTVAEAMARGKIVVAADIGGPAELITGGRSGLLFEAGSSSALTEALGKALSMREYDRREMQHQARLWTKEHLNQDTIASQYEELFELRLNS